MAHCMHLRCWCEIQLTFKRDIYRVYDGEREILTNTTLFHLQEEESQPGKCLKGISVRNEWQFVKHVFYW